MNYPYDGNQNLSDQENMAFSANKRKIPSTGSMMIKRSKSSQPKPASVSRRNARERRRVKQVNDGFVVLREHVPKGQKNKKLSKVETLKAAIDYIQQLSTMLGGELPALLSEQLPALIKQECSSESSLSPPPSQVSGSDESVNNDECSPNDSWNSMNFVQDYANEMNQYHEFQCPGYVIADADYQAQQGHYQDLSASLPSYYPHVFQNSSTHSPTPSQTSEMSSSPGFGEQCNQFNNVFNELRTSSLLL